MSFAASSRSTLLLSHSHSPNELRESEQVCRNVRQKESKARDRRCSALDRDRPKIRLLVAEQETLRESRMQAYEIVGRIFGRSESWVRRLLGGVAVAFSADQQEALHRAYAAYCARLQDHAAAVMAEAKLRWDEVDAIDAGHGPAADGSGDECPEQAGPGDRQGRGPRNGNRS